MELNLAMIRFGKTQIAPQIDGGLLHSLGAVAVAGIPLRSPQARFLPWFDAFEGGVFDRLRFLDLEATAERAVIHTRALASSDYPFRERRDSSGDLCLRTCSWDAPPAEADFHIVIEPFADTIDGLDFRGFRYWFEYESNDLPIHRLVDRQTWEPGGRLADHRIFCRNWMTPPLCPIGVDDHFSTVGLDRSASLMPGNLWARWSLLPGFDMIACGQGMLLAWFDRVSLVRSVLETQPGEACLRVVDIHAFEQATTVSTNPKTVAWHAGRLDDTALLNLWTRMADRDHDLACRQFNIAAEPPPAITFAKNIWVDMHVDRSYDDAIEAAAELGAEVVFIDPIWENAEALNVELRALLGGEPVADSALARRVRQSMCCTLDFRVAAAFGGEDGLRRLCQRAAAKGIRIVSWMATHLSPTSRLRETPPEGVAANQLFANKESGVHPDGGYPGDCWPLNLNGPMFDYLRDRLLGVCQRTGLAGFLWDSFSNLGWWQLDYAGGTLRPQFDRLGQLYADLANAGLYLLPEGLAACSNHNSLGQFGDEIYQGEAIAFAYNSAIPFHDRPGAQSPTDTLVLTGKLPIDPLFRAFAHKWIPNSNLWQAPRQTWDAAAVAEIKRLYATYKVARPHMVVRTILANHAGIHWHDPKTGAELLWSFQNQPLDHPATEIGSTDPTPVAHAHPNRVYRLSPGNSGANRPSDQKRMAASELRIVS